MAIRKRVALVTGANRGLGFETARLLGKMGMKVILTARTHEKAEAAAALLHKEDLDVTALPLDTAHPAQILEAASVVHAKFGYADILINNAGVFLDGTSGNPQSAFETTPDTFEKTWRTNTLGPFFLCQAFIPLMKSHGYGRVVNVSSGLGQLNYMGSGMASYRVSKTGLNALTKLFSEEVKGSGILVNAVCPGWVRTDMGGPNAERTLAQGVDTIVWAATLPQSGLSGQFFRDREPIPW